ncbi:retrovirus-related pol polyprotein from transposon TNT 1-94 [Tanacetum coccineum]
MMSHLSLKNDMPLQDKLKIDNPNITIEEFIRLQEEKSLSRGETFNWQTATYDKMEYCEDEDYCFTNFELEFPAIVLDDTSREALSWEPIVSPLNDNEIDFRISFDESDDKTTRKWIWRIGQYVVSKNGHGVSMDMAYPTVDMAYPSQLKKILEYFIHLKAQLQDKDIAISELKKLIEKMNGKSVEIKIEKPLVIRQSNAFKSQRQSILVQKNRNVIAPGMYKVHTMPNQTRTTQLPQHIRKTNKRVSFSTRVIPTTSISRPQLKSNKLEDRVMHNNSQRKKQQVEDHRRNFKVSNNKTFVTTCNDSLNAKTSNVNFVCVTYGKYVLNDNHDMCVLHYINGVNTRTKQLIVVPISTRKPKRTVNQYVATPLKKTVALESTNQKPRSTIRKQYENLIKIILFIVDSGCLKHMTGNLNLLSNFVEKFLSMVRFGNDQIVLILGYGDLVQVMGNDLLTAWLWHRRLSHLNFDTINLLLKYDIVTDLPKLKFVKDHLCSSCELGKAKRKSFKTKTTPSSKRRLQILHMDLYGPMRVESFNGKKYVLVIVDDYSRYTWTHFLRSKDETPKVLIEFLKLVERGLHAQVRTVQTDKGTKLLNKTLHAYFAQEAETVTMSNELDLLFSLMFDELLNGTTTVVLKSFAVTAANTPDQPPTQAPAITSTMNINQAETQKENAQVEEDEFINIFSTPVQEQGETSSRYVDSSNMHTFYQRHPFEHRWTKDHPLEQVIRNPSQSIRTRRQLETDGEMCMFALTVSRTEPKNIKEAMADSAWIEAM